MVLWAPRYRQEVAKDWYESAKGYRKGESMNRAGERGSLLGGERPAQRGWTTRSRRVAAKRCAKVSRLARVEGVCFRANSQRL